MVRSSEELLIAVVDAEEAGVDHWESCRACQIGERCEEGLRLIKASVLATTSAKLYVDRLKGRVGG